MSHHDRYNQIREDREARRLASARIRENKKRIAEERRQMRQQIAEVRRRHYNKW